MATSADRPLSPFQVLNDYETASSSGEYSADDATLSKRKRQEDIDVWADEPDELDEYKKSRKPKRAKTANVAKRRGKGASAARSSLRGSLQGFKDKADESIPEEGVPDRNAGIIPQHILGRRQQFNGDRETLGQSGLKLPPAYDDIYFSDDERDPKGLEERPKFDPEFDHAKPCRPYEDIVLENSAGLIPASIAQYLRDYQVDGVKFLHEKFVYQKGAILGDDMGLGKTVQVAAFLTVAFGKTGDERDSKRLRKMRRNPGRWYPRVLIVCPSGLMPNWKNELNRWGWWKIEVCHSSGRDDALKAARNGAIEIMLTTYSTYKNCQDQINLIEWDVVIADECHQIKDGTRQVTQAMDRVNALCRIGLTGTAIQNNYEEFWTLLNWTNPGYFGALREWKNSVVKPLTLGQSHVATLQQLSLARKTAKKLVHNLLPEFFLRRMKTLIAHQLPKKTDKVVFCPLTDLQKEAYEKLLETEEVEAILLSVEICECGSGLKQGWCCGKTLPDGTTWMAHVFPMMTALKLLSNHLSLLVPSNEEADKLKRHTALKRLRACVPKHWATLYQNRNSVHMLSNPDFCGKWKILKELLAFWYENNDKVLIFSHSVQLLHYLESLFKTTSYTVSFLSGSQLPEVRQNEVDDFNSDPGKFVFLISTKAGGVGLNITSANKVVIFDPHWNPSYDLQAQDRAYRIGQRRNVEVYRLVSAGTIEEIVYARQIYKQQQANIGYNASTERRYFKGVQQDKDRKGELFGLRNIFSFHGNQVVLQNIMHQTNVAEARAGAQMIDLDVDKVEEEDEFKHIKKEDKGDDDYGLSQFATLLKSENPEEVIRKNKASKEHDHAIQAILAHAGVQYTHENSEVIGSSKVEAQLSRRAELVDDVDWGELGEQSALFADEEANDAFADGDELAGSGFTPMFKPPQEVKDRQFCSMAAEFGFESVTEFALVVEQMTQQERRDALDAFYKKRMIKLLEAELRKAEGADGEKVEILKAEAGISEDSKPKMNEGLGGVVVKNGDSTPHTKGLIDGARPISSIFIDDDDEDDEL